ncbi:hypothetical protein BTO30_09100 [Domibacillus antri]|uniref:DUF3906 domain-containing protein n=1 Tax=Domibacillus antri TaxID=1714264 RepID=A0A1Q8Q5A8_9BACI|nr:DUF3906 family protein [Domibacillus antri]OLN22461.1 hypothetical protein BTO30_09100 [Domibacillus antri]
MYLYRFDIVLTSGETVQAVILAENDEQAFSQVDDELEKFYVTLPDYKEVTLYEKKRIRGGAGYIPPAPGTDTR